MQPTIDSRFRVKNKSTSRIGPDKSCCLLRTNENEAGIRTCCEHRTLCVHKSSVVGQICVARTALVARGCVEMTSGQQSLRSLPHVLRTFKNRKRRRGFASLALEITRNDERKVLINKI